MENNQNTFILKPKGICFTPDYIKITDSGKKQYQIFYKELILASLQTFDDKSGAYCEPEITNITKAMEGDLILYGFGNTRWQIRMEETGKTAGSALSDLAAHAPHILIGRQTWIDIEDEEEFEILGDMVNLMGQC